jgi:mRNA interferase HigB
LTISRFGIKIYLSSLPQEKGSKLHIRAERTLREYEEKYPNAKPQLWAWREDTLLAEWQSPNDVKARYANASVLDSQRVVFNIAGNQYRLIVAIHYKSRIVHIRWFGTHAEYDRINAYEV